MINEDPREVVRRLFRDVDAGREDFVDEYYAADYVDHTPSRTRARASGREGVREAFALFRKAFPDIQHSLEDVIGEGDKVVVRLRAWGTHRGALFGISPTGRRVEQSGIVIYRLREGRILERWAQADSEVLDQLGVTPGAEAAPPAPVEHGAERAGGPGAGPPITRLWRTGVDPVRWEEYAAFEHSRSLPMFRQQRGCLGVLFLRTGDASAAALSLWSGRTDIDAMEASPIYQATVADLEATGLLQGSATVEIFAGAGGWLQAVS
jgi:predicted ester cyclase